MAIDEEGQWQHIFQSTHPSWGATLKEYHGEKAVTDFNPRTHRGVRRFCVFLFCKSHYFNPRTHRGVRPGKILKFSTCKAEFQSTHPSWGATKIAVGLNGQWIISIHAPIVGCDEERGVTSLA